MSEINLPTKVIVNSVQSNRYSKDENSENNMLGKKPLSWDKRIEGYDLVNASINDDKDKTGINIKLLSDGGQCVPAPGWTLMLTSGNQDKGYEWTLYGFERN